jgi:thioredoxin 1
MPSLTDEQAFKHEVLQSSLPVVVHFWAPWCGVCRMIEPTLQHLVRESNSCLKLVGVNADENLKLASAYKITNLPTVLLFKEGKLLHRLDRVDRKDQLLQTLQQIMPGLVSEVSSELD